MASSNTDEPTRSEKLSIMYQDIRIFLYNKEKGEVMGRNGSSWGKISLFFFVYYACLAGFFATMFAIAFSTMPDIKDGPKYTSFLEDKPALLVYPPGGLGAYGKNHREGLITSYKNFLKAYVEQYQPCYGKVPCKPGDSYRLAEETTQCYFDIDQLSKQCSPADNGTFGLDNKRPCLFLRLTKSYGWKPEPLNGSKYVGIHCTADNDEAKIYYHPSQEQFFPISFWPFRGEKYFMTPIGAIQVETKRATTVKCKALAKNIELSDTFKLKRGATGQLEFTVAGAPDN